MAKINTIARQIFFLILYAGFHISTVSGQGLRTKVWKQAEKDIGLLEGSVNNTGKTQKYATYWNTLNPKRTLPLNTAYCGVATFYWFHKAGLQPNINWPARAIEWQRDCKSLKSVWKLTKAELEALPLSSVIIFQNPNGSYHSGLLGYYKEGDFFSIEGNTSSGRSVHKYSKREEGVFLLKTPLVNRYIRPVYVCDVIPQSTKL